MIITKAINEHKKIVDNINSDEKILKYFIENSQLLDIIYNDDSIDNKK